MVYDVTSAKSFRAMAFLVDNGMSKQCVSLQPTGMIRDICISVALDSGQPWTVLPPLLITCGRRSHIFAASGHGLIRLG